MARIEFPRRRTDSLISAGFVLIVLAIFVSPFIGYAGTPNAKDYGQSVPKLRGMCFGPHRDNENPDAGIQPTLSELSEDVEFIAHLTESIRTYGAADNLEYIPGLCEQYGIDCYPGAWLSEYPCDNDRQITGLIEIGRAGYSCIKGLIVGSEVLLRHDMSVDQLVELINRVKDSTDLPVTTAEVWADWVDHPELAEAVDFILVHVYGFWDGIVIDSAAGYALEKWNEVQTRYPNKRVVIGETGWPSAGEPRGNAIPSEANQRRYLSEFVAMADSQAIDYFYFEIFDEAWKGMQAEGSVGSHWGLYESTGQLKPPLTELIPEAAQAGINRPGREVFATPAALPLYIYTDACDSQNAFYPSGWMGALAEYGENDSAYSDYKKIIDMACTDNPYSGQTCIRISYRALGWGGIYWQFPVNNWGTYPGYDLSHSVSDSAYVKLRFYGRGQNGGELAKFVSGGIKGLEYEDSYGPRDADYYLRFNKYWQLYEINLTGADLSMVIGGFAWVSLNYTFGVDTIYLDDIEIIEAPEDGTIKQGDIYCEWWTVSGSPYRIIGDVNVFMLRIDPGVTVLFMGDYDFEVSGGFLEAYGEPEDTIYFTKPDSVPGWQGISGNGSVVLWYCSITGSSNSGVRISGGRAYVGHCLIASNRGAQGGGIDATDMISITLDSCNVLDNTAAGIDAKGGGVYIDAGTARVTDCRISGNTVTIEECVDNGGGGGIYIDGNAEITRCAISDNSVSCAENQSLWNRPAIIAGGGVFSVGNLRLNGSEIRSNRMETPAFAPQLDSFLTHSRGSGVYACGDSTIIKNSILSYNDLMPSVDDTVSGGNAGIYVISPFTNIENCAIAYNGGGVYGAGNGITALNSIIWDNRLYQLAGSVNATYCDISSGYPGIGNIHKDPMFISSEELRISDSSPCVDAGHYAIGYNDSCQPPALGCLWNDMGAHGGPGSCVWGGIHVYEDTGTCRLMRQYTLQQNYPNPFNSSTRIRFSLPKPEHVKLTISNILGQRVTTLVNMDLPPGEHVTIWNGTNSLGKAVASGIYLYRLETDGFAETRKMILLK